MPFPPSKHREALEEAKRRGIDPSRVPTKEQVVDSLKRFVGNLDPKEAREKMRDFQSMSAKKKLEYVQQFAKTFDPNNNPPDVHGARPIATFEEFVKETKSKQDDVLDPADNDLTPNDVIGALGDTNFRKHFERLSGLSTDRVDNMLQLFNTMNKINRQGGPQNLSTQQQAQAYRDMESVMKMMEEDRLPGPGVDAVKSSKYADVFSQYEKEHGGAQTEQSKTQTQSTRTKPQSQSQKPKTDTAAAPPSFKTSTPTTSSSDDIDPQFMKDNFSPDAMMKMMEQFAGSQMPGGAPEGAPGGSAPGGDNEMAEMMKKMFGNQSGGSPKPKSSHSSPFAEEDLRDGREMKRDDYDKMMETMLDPSLGGLQSMAPDSYKDAFEGDRAHRATWLGKKPEDMRIADIPHLLADYHQLAAENVVMREQLKEIKKEYRIEEVAAETPPQ